MVTEKVNLLYAVKMLNRKSFPKKTPFSGKKNVHFSNAVKMQNRKSFRQKILYLASLTYKNLL